MLDVTNAPAAEEAVAIDLEPTCDHAEPLLRTMSIEEICDEWWLLRRWEPHPQYNPTDECQDRGECRVAYGCRNKPRSRHYEIARL
jgi:hypothetical protein